MLAMLNRCWTMDRFSSMAVVGHGMFSPERVAA